MPKRVGKAEAEEIVRRHIGYRISDEAKLIYAKRYSETIGIASFCVVYELTKVDADKLKERFQLQQQKTGSLRATQQKINSPARRGCSRYLTRSSGDTDSFAAVKRQSGQTGVMIYFNETNQTAAFELYSW